MALTREFSEAVKEGNLLRVRIMLKDSLLVDTSFEQFNEMCRFAEQNLKDLWISDDEDDEVFSQSPAELNNILVGLVNKFSKRRISYLEKLIKKLYPPKPKLENRCNKSQRTKNNEYESILFEMKKIQDICSKFTKRKCISINSIAAIKKAAMDIIKLCDKISGK